jgi:hypothetical protein
MSKRKDRYEFDNEGLNDKIEEAIDEGYAGRIPPPSDDAFDELDEPPPDQKYAGHLNAYDREVRYGKALEENHVMPEAEAMEREREEYHSVSPRLSGGDVDADWQRAESVGEEAVGGSVSTPDQDVVDEIGRAVGMEFQDNQELLSPAEVMEKRDRHRWELDRRSADDADPASQE